MKILTRPNSSLESVEEPDCIPQPVLAARAILEQGIALLSSIPSDAYAQRHPLAFNASIGGHYRHCLDHFVSLVRAEDCGEVDFDRRDRDPLIETDPSSALEATARIQEWLLRLTSDELKAKIPVRCSINYDAAEVPVYESTLGRELIYAIMHAVHHFALIAFLARQSGLATPENFGLAPSTAKYRAQCSMS